MFINLYMNNLILIINFFFFFFGKNNINIISNIILESGYHIEMMESQIPYGLLMLKNSIKFEYESQLSKYAK